MTIHLIAAMTKNRVIGANGQLAWHLPKDLQHFKKITWDKPIVMGRKTYDSIGKALPGRKNIVLTRDADWHAPGIETAHSIQAVLSICNDDADIMIIGGGEIYQQFLPLADSIYLTVIDADIPGDTSFPELNPDIWRVTRNQAVAADADHPYDFAFLHYTKQ